MRLAWGITGSGDKLYETVETMKKLKEKYGESLNIEVFLSKAGLIVAKYYHLEGILSRGFNKYWVEQDANTPFLAGRLQIKSFDLFMIAPATSNTVAKLAVGVSDTLLTNAAIQAVKGYIPVYIMPVDYYEGTTTTILPNGKTLKLRVRKEDVENVRKLESMEGFHLLDTPSKICEILDSYIQKEA